MITNKSVFILLALILCILPIEIKAQKNITLTGRVTVKSSGKPLPDVIVSLRTSGKVSEFTNTSTDGYYKMQLSDMPDNAILRFSMMGFASKDVSIIPNCYQYNVVLEEHETELKEVVIKAPKIRQKGDTILYNVSSYASTSDKSLADVLKRMPGIDVADNGEIKYNGISINKFYIEGHDMLGGKYGLATNNIHHGDVGTVEVLDNHQPIKALEDISLSTQPAINIRLKESAKKRVVGTLKTGGGVAPGVWRDELTLMRFTPKMQTLNTLKTNNSGDNILTESGMQISDMTTNTFSKSYKMYDFIDVVPSYSAEIDGHRTRRNQSHSVNVNNLWALGKNTDLSTVIHYGHERLLFDSHSSTSYLLPDSTITIGEDETAKTHHHELSADMTLQKNTESLYINNKLSVNLDWNDTRNIVTGTMPNRQEASTPHYKFQENFEILKRTGSKTFILNSYNNYQVSPHNLDVISQGSMLNQHIHSASFYSNTNTSFGFSFNPITLWIKTGIIGMNRTMTSKTAGMPDSLGLSTNDIRVTYFDFYASPVVELKVDGFNAKLEVPFAIAPYNYKNYLTSKQESHTKYIMSPNLYMQYYLTSSLCLSLSGQITHRAIDEQEFYGALILNDYRHISLGLIDFNTSLRKSVMFGCSLKKPIHAFFANMTATRIYADYSKMQSRTFCDNFTISSYLPQRHTGQSWLIQGSVSKGIDFINGLISLAPMYIYSDGQLYQSGCLSPFVSKSWFINARLKSKVSKYMELSYEFNYTNNEMRAKDIGIRNTTDGLTHRFMTNVIFSDRFYATLKGEYYDNQIDDSNRKHLFLGDFSVTYCMKKGWEFSIEARNILNQKSYAYTSYSDLLVMSKEYTIRSRNIIARVLLHF